MIKLQFSLATQLARALRGCATGKDPTMESAFSHRFWHLIAVEVDRAAEEMAGFLLFEQGANGIITLEERVDGVRLGGYFDQHADPQALVRTLEARFEQAEVGSRLLAVSIELVPDQDWMQKWREGLEPIEVSGRLIVAPSWNPPTDVGDRVVIEIDPGQAFGTGSHETTRLCLEAIERHWRGGSLLDVGTGTGILAIAAALLSPGSTIVAVDVDPVAVSVARENVEKNRVPGSIKVLEGSASDFTGKKFDLVVANLTADVIVNMAMDLVACVSDAGVLVLSGILDGSTDEVRRALDAVGASVLETSGRGEWVALIATRVRE